MFSRKDNQQNNFLRLVELHERAWGTDKYAERPRLEEIMSARVVAFWYPTKRRDDRYTVTLHTDSADLGQELLDVVFHSDRPAPERRLYALFLEQKPLKLTGVRVLVEK